MRLQQKIALAVVALASLAFIATLSGCGGGGGTAGMSSGPTTCTAPQCQPNVPCYNPCDGKTYLNGVPQK